MPQCFNQCFSIWVLRNLKVPQRGVRVSDRRKCVMAEECYWWSSICTYELKFVWPHSTLIILSLKARRQQIAASIQKQPDPVLKSVSIARHRKCRCVSLAVDISHVTYIKDKSWCLILYLSYCGQVGVLQ